MNTLFQFGKRRMMARMLGRVVGGPWATAFMAAYFGKKMWDRRRASRALSARPY